MPPVDRLTLLGPPTFVRGARSWPLPFERRNQMMVLLALAGTWVGRRELAETLWPDIAGPLASNNLRKTLFRMPALEWGGSVRAEGGALRFDGTTDIADFDAALRESRLDDALALWRGEPLAGFDDDANEAWTERLRDTRDRLRTTWRSAAHAWLEGDVPAPAAVDLSARLLEADPWDERALALHLRALERNGRAAAAKQVHARFVERVRDELGVTPTPALVALVSPPADPARPPPPDVRLPAAAGGALDPGFVGRGAELRRIASHLESDDVRLLTLLGPGGVGKTRLARRALQELSAGFADGVAFVELEDVDDPDGIDARVARELGLAGAQSDATERLLRHLSSRRMLIALDNVEHLTRGAQRFERWLDACPGLKLIVTSRVRLALACEHLLPLEGLPCPEPEDVDRIDAFDAVKLFERAARRVDPAFRLQADPLSVIDICRRVGGLPLALELAAAWTRVLPCAEIATELERGTALLRATGTEHDVRHASLESVFDRSWRLLTPTERGALARLAVFHGGFTAEAAREVAAAPPPVLASLADQSLLRKDGARLHLHPLVAELTAARTAGTPAAGAAARAHADFFLRTMARWEPAMRDGRREALEAMDAEFENCRAAWRHVAATADADVLARGAWTLTDYCDLRGRAAEASALIDAALTIAAPASKPRSLATLRAAAAHLLYRQDRYAEARRLAAQALDGASDTAGADAVISTAHGTLGSCAMQLGELTDAAGHYGEIVRRARASGDPLGEARALMNLAIVDKAAGHYDLALEHYGQSLAIHRQFGDAGGEMRSLHNLALVHLARGDYAAARARLQAALALCERNGFISSRPIVLSGMVECARLAGDYDDAERHAQAALAAAQPLGLRGTLCSIRCELVHLALHRRAFGDAREALAEAAQLALELGRPTLQLAVAGAFAELLAALGADDAALRMYTAIATHPATSDPERETIRTRIARLPHGGVDAPHGDAVAREIASDLPKLLRRLVAEAGIDYTPLVSALTAAPMPR